MGGPIWLVGMMGAGKSVVGRALARRLGRPFADTDERIERAAGMTVSEIFAREGEAGFRDRERAAIEALCGGDDVVALGGGAIAQPGMASKLAACGRVVYLRARIETLLDRIGDASDRPLLAELDADARAERLSELLERRAPAYASAKLCVDTDTLGVDEVVEAIVADLGEGAP